MSTEATLLDALRAVPGVAAADLEPDERPDGAGTLRLQLAPGADEIAVATSVNRVLREQFGLAVDAGRVQVVEESVPIGRRPRPTVPRASRQPTPAGRTAAPLARAGAGAGRQPRPSASDLSPPSPSYSDAAPESTGQLETAEPDDELTPQLVESTRPPRILIQRMQLVSAGLGVTTSVSLSWLGEALRG